ncbi:hypothetical protein [Microcoleus sp. herbarium14]
MLAIAKIGDRAFADSDRFQAAVKISIWVDAGLIIIWKIQNLGTQKLRLL